MIRDDAPPPPDLPDVWDGAELEEESAGRAQAGLDKIYADRTRPAPAGSPADGGAADDVPEIGLAPPPAATIPRREEPPSALFTITSHVVIPAATITMVTALLFFLYDVRAVFLPGSEALKWVGFCFSAATVLIARYARLSMEATTAKLYTDALAVVTVLTIWMSPWDAPEVGFLGAASNAVIIFIVWRYATTLTERLSADLEVPPPEPLKLYGIERLEMEAAKRASTENRFSIYDIGRSSAGHSDAWRADGEAATRQVAGLMLVALAGVAVAEPFLLAGAPILAGQALGAVTVFLFAAGVVMAAAASIRDQQRLRSAGAESGEGGLTARLALGAALVACLVTSGLSIPGLETPEGSGEIRQLGTDSGALAEDAAGQPEETEDPAAEEPPLEEPRQAPGGPSWLEWLAGVGRWLRWPVIAAVAVLLVVGLWRLGPGLWRAFRSAAAGLLARFGRRRPERSRRRRRDPFAAAGDLGALPPREAVLQSYAIWLDACAHLDHVREPRQTPLEFLAAIPRALSDLRPVGEKITRLYTGAAYATREIDDAAAAAARRALGELRSTVEVIKGRGDGSPAQGRRRAAGR